MRRNTFEGPLAESLSLADGIVLGPVNRANLLSDAERLSPDRIVALLTTQKRKASAFPSADAIVDYLSREAKSGDVILVMSNGSFDGLCGKLVDRFSKSAVAKHQGRK
jgi:UDP-N-acetylmuramate: L-alanyl-gamma-D-glutamyl-meso-diaminopimelate ligase